MDWLDIVIAIRAALRKLKQSGQEVPIKTKFSIGGKEYWLEGTLKRTK